MSGLLRRSQPDLCLADTRFMANQQQRMGKGLPWEVLGNMQETVSANVFPSNFTTCFLIQRSSSSISHAL